MRSASTPWLKINPNYVDINVEEQQGREDSVLRYYQRLIALRKSDEFRQTFTYGAVTAVFEDMPYVMAYIRSDENHRILVASNFGEGKVTLPLEGSEVLLSNMDTALWSSTGLTLESCRCVVLRL